MEIWPSSKPKYFNRNLSRYFKVLSLQHSRKCSWHLLLILCTLHTYLPVSFHPLVFYAQHNGLLFVKIHWTYLSPDILSTPKVDSMFRNSLRLHFRGRIYFSLHYVNILHQPNTYNPNSIYLTSMIHTKTVPLTSW